MNENVAIRPIDPVEVKLDSLAQAARREGYRFVDRLANDWVSGNNRFSEPGEQLLGVFEETKLIALGGLNRDPYSRENSVGRLRHLYVLPPYRCRGIGRRLVTALLEGASRFEKIRLRTTPLARPFYETCGFRPCDEADATHVLVLRSDEHAT